MLWEIARDRRRLHKDSTAKYDAARNAGKSQDEVWAVVAEAGRGYRYLDDLRIKAEGAYLYEIASKLRISYPNNMDKTLWNDNPRLGLILTEKALTDFRAAVRNERGERWRYLETRLKVIGVLLTAATGAIGALIGLIATWRVALTLFRAPAKKSPRSISKPLRLFRCQSAGTSGACPRYP